LSRATWILFGCGWLVAGCGGAPETASKNSTFYDWATGGAAASAAAGEQFEQRYPPLDLAETQPNPEYVGVTVVRGGVHLSRPKNWHVREAGNDPGHSYIQYISPKAYSFGVYELPDSPSDSWRDVLSRYEDDVTAAGAQIVGRRVPMATWRGQGRAFSIERKVDAAKRPLVSHSREFVLRGDHRIVIVQVVHEGENLSALDEELIRVVRTFEVL